MRRMLLLAALCMTLSTAFASAALAQDEFDCADFATQEEAQAVYDEDTSDPSGLDGPIGTGFTGEEGVACEELPSGETGTDMSVEPAAETSAEPSASPTAADPRVGLDCDDYGAQEEAQAAVAADPSDPNVLDRDNDGVACETFDYGDDSTATAEADGDESASATAGAEVDEEETASPSATTTATTTATAEADEDESASATAVAEENLPDTGGVLPALTLVPLALLLGAGLLSFRVLRRD